MAIAMCILQHALVVASPSSTQAADALLLEAATSSSCTSLRLHSLRVPHEPSKLYAFRQSTSSTRMSPHYAVVKPMQRCNLTCRP